MKESSARLVLLRLIQSGAGIIASVLGTIFIFILVARSLGPADFGLFALAYATASLFGIAFDFGYVTRLLRDTGGLMTAHGGLPGRIVQTKIMLFVVLTPLLLLVGWIAQMQLGLLLAIWLGVASLSVGNLFGTMLKSVDLHLRDSLHLLCANGAGVIAALILTQMQAPPAGFALIFVIIGTIYTALTVRLWRHHFEHRPEAWNMRAITTEIRCNLSYALDVFTQRSFGFLDIAILSIVTNPAAVGLYQAGQKVAQGAGVLSQPFNSVMLPRLSRITHEQKRWRSLAIRFFAMQSLVGFAALAGLSLLGPWMISLIYTAEYDPVRGDMWLFGVLMCVRYISAALGLMVTSLGQQRKRMIVNMVGVVAFILYAPVLANNFAIEGMLSAMVLSALSILSGYLIVLAMTLKTNDAKAFHDG
ncbi:lipopolysaccharide biosynthesis protein [Pontivivens nitratireducens]|uniref:Lipopolysaccharide biosynthesis protein n=1 Tax=Pontivivens nitratireducens TaxID=2758038 RepID=A0A6G7VR26_9RHOB|nr:lipopolysaccharide biosynthesis protein [Pontibrevibacter nitratireducens]QIK42336.1 lipopolysaccharide biosynthesis protein [Pontibrevibacter nitratireducens]